MKRQWTRWQIGLGVILLVVAGYAAATGLRQCAWLDSLLRLSGCVWETPSWGYHNLEISPDGERLTARYIQDARIYDAARGNRIEPGLDLDGLLSREGLLSDDDAWHLPNIDFSLDGSTILTAIRVFPDGAAGTEGATGIMAYWDAVDGSLLDTVKFQNMPWIVQAAYAPGEETVILATENDVRLLDAASGTLLEIVMLQDYEKTTFATFSPMGDLLLANTGDQVQVWEMPGGDTLYALENSGSVATPVFSRDGRFIVAEVLWQDRARIWRADDGTVIQDLDLPAPAYIDTSPFVGSGWEIALSPDGMLLAAMFDRTYQLGDVRELPPVAELASDYSLRLWRVADGALVQTIERHYGSGDSLAFSPDGRFVVFGGVEYGRENGAYFRMWRVPR